MHDLFSTSPAMENAALWRLDVRVKLAVALAGIVAVILSTRVALPLAAAAACFATLAVMRAPLRVTARRMLMPLALAGIVALMRTFMAGGDSLGSARLWGWQISASRQGLADGALVAARVLGSVSVLVLLVTFTPAYRVFAALQWARMPRNFVEIAMMMYRYIFTLFEQAQSVRCAQGVRLGYRGTARSIRSAAALAGIVALRSIDQADKTHEAMTARGYRGSLQLPPLASLPRRDAAVIAISLAVLAAAFALAQRSPL